MAIIIDYLRGKAANAVDAASKFGFEQYRDSRGLPRDAGYSEKVAGKNNPYYFGTSTYANTTPQQSSEVRSVNRDIVAPPVPQAQVPGGGLNQQTGGNFNNPNPQQPVPSGPSEMDVINQEFDAFSSFLNDQAGLANKNFRNTESAIISDRDLSLQSAENRRAQQQGQLDTQAIEGKQSEALNLAKVRQLLAELDQRNNARMAITGGGSVSEALSDRFARTAQQNVGGVLQEGQRFQNDIRGRKADVEAFYTEKTGQIREAARQAIEQARFKLDENLAAINAEKRASAAEKSRAKLGAWQSYLGKVNEARLQAANFQAQYDMWRGQMGQQMEAVNSFNYDPLQAQQFSQYYFNPNSPAVIAPNQSAGGFAPTYFSQGIRRPDEEQEYITPALGVQQ